MRREKRDRAGSALILVDLQPNFTPGGALPVEDGDLFCVKWSAEDAAGAGFATAVLWDLTRPVDPASDERVRGDLHAAGVEVLTSERLPA